MIPTSGVDFWFLKRKESHASWEWRLFGPFLGVMARRKQSDFGKNKEESMDGFVG